MFTKVLQAILVTGVTATSSMVLGDSGLSVVVPVPPPVSRPADSGTTAVADAQRALANAQQRAQAAHAELANTQAKLKSVKLDLQSRTEASTGLAEANEATANAKALYEKRVEPILASLLQRADYRDACVAAALAQKVSTEVCARDGAGIDERLAAAQAVLSTKATVAQLENAAVEDMPDVVDAKQAYIKAAEHLREVYGLVWQMICSDPAYIAAKDAALDAQERAAIADHQLAAARQDLSVVQFRVADKQHSWQRATDGTKPPSLSDLK